MNNKQKRQCKRRIIEEQKLAFAAVIFGAYLFNKYKLGELNPFILVNILVFVFVAILGGYGTYLIKEANGVYKNG